MGPTMTGTQTAEWMRSSAMVWAETAPGESCDRSTMEQERPAAAERMRERLMPSRVQSSGAEPAAWTISTSVSSAGEERIAPRVKPVPERAASRTTRAMDSMSGASMSLRVQSMSWSRRWFAPGEGEEPRAAERVSSSVRAVTREGASEDAPRTTRKVQRPTRMRSPPVSAVGEFGARRTPLTKVPGEESRSVRYQRPTEVLEAVEVEGREATRVEDWCWMRAWRRETPSLRRRTSLPTARPRMAG